MTPKPGNDGFHHPEGDAEIIALVRWARENGRMFRVRGSGHSPAHAIYTDPLDTLDNRVIGPGPPDRGTADGTVDPPPHSENVNVLLDVDPGYCVLSQKARLVEADAGMPLSTLLRKLSKCHGWMLAGTGGIAHQTVGGFTATASAGGSLTRPVNDSICGFSLIDGTGRRWEVNRGDAHFAAMVPNLGLLGIVTKVRLCCIEDYTVKGRQTTTDPDDGPVKLRGASEPGRRSLSAFLEDATYARIEWWPQRNAERVIAWAAEPRDLPVPFEPKRFELFRPNKPQIAQLVSGIIYTVLGNLDDSDRWGPELADIFDRLRRDHVLAGELLCMLRKELGELGDRLATFIEKALRRDLHESLDTSDLVAWLIEKKLPNFFPDLLTWLVPLDADLGGCQPFHDHAWRGLPMDDVVDDVYMPVGFTEIWVPMSCVEDVMQLLHTHFKIGEAGDDDEAYECTGTFAIELYATKANDFWLNPAYSDGKDEWAGGAFRVNPYWYGRNAVDPAAKFFPMVWGLLRENKIPYRLHWGKFLPLVDHDPGWVSYIKRRYPRWEDFMRLRAERDPDGIFLNEYWRKQLGIDG